MAAAVLATACGGLLLGVAPAAYAQSVPTLPPVPELPPIPAPQPPAQAQPVFELVAPTVFPECGAGALLVFLAGSTLAQQGVQVGGNLYDVTGPVFAVCGAVPRPPAQYECLLDAQQDALLNTLEARAAGTTVPLGVHPEGIAVEQAIVVQDKLPPPISTAALGSLAVQFLACSPVETGEPESNQYFPPITEPSNEPFSSTPSGYIPATAGTQSRTFAGYGTGAATTPLPPTVRPSTPIGEGIRYAAIWLLPLGLLAMFGYLGPALTREVPLTKA